MKKTIYITAYFSLLLIFSVDCRAQGETYMTTIDLTEPGNATWIKPSTDKIGDMLIDGYLSGKLRGYSEGIVERLEYAPVPPEDLPGGWEKGHDYWVYDLVSYEGQYYECWDDDADLNLPPLNNKQWHPYTLNGDLVSQHWAFPDVQDTLSKVELLDRVTMTANESFMSWQSGNSYYAGDLVEYGGYNYQAMTDVTGSKPPSDDKENWVYHPNSVFFTRPNEMNMVEIISCVDRKRLDPQILGLSMTTPEGYYKKIIYFYYEEAINYLSHVRQPMLYTNPYGYFGANELVMNEQVRINLLQQIKRLAKIKAKSLAPGITDSKAFFAFQNDTTEITDLSRWKIMQSLDGNQLRLSQYQEQPFLSVPTSALKKTLSKKKVVLATYAGRLQAHKFMETTGMYPDIPEKPRTKGVEEPARVPEDLCFREAYVKVLDSLGNLKMQLLWKKMVEANKIKPIQQINPFMGFFPSNYDWSNRVYSLPAKGDFKFEKDFQIGYGDTGSFVKDTLVRGSYIILYQVTYERSSGRFVPLEFTISVETPDTYFVSYTFDWKVIKPMLTSSDPQLVEAIEKGTVNYTYSELKYGLVER